jgi:hypothetical protein
MKQRRQQMRIEIRGNADFRKALRRFAPDIHKQLQIELRTALRPIATAAKGFAPADGEVLSGWRNRSFNEGSFPTYSRATVVSKIGFKTTPSKVNSKGYSSAVTIYNNSRAGAIYESAGRNGAQGQPWVGPKGPAGHKYSHSRNPKAGEQFIASMPELTSSLRGRGRLIFRAWAANQGKTEGAVMKALSKAEMELVNRSKSGMLGKAA